MKHQKMNTSSSQAHEPRAKNHLDQVNPTRPAPDVSSLWLAYLTPGRSIIQLNLLLYISR